MGILVEDGFALCLAHLLEDDLLGQLRGNAPQRSGVAVEPDLAAQLDLRRQLLGLGEGDLVQRVL